MAVGVPASGIGTIYYIILSIAILLRKIVKKILSFLKKESTSNRPSILLRFPPLAFILCITLLIYMNITGFRPVIPGTQQATVPISARPYLWIFSVFAVSVFTFFISLFHIRANERTHIMKERIRRGLTAQTLDDD
jgi:hypothetical protein